MMTITKEFKEKIRTALLAVRPNFDGSDTQFAKSWSIPGSSYNRIKNGQVENVLATAHWIGIARDLGVGIHDKKWNPVKTDVFITIEEDIIFCQQHSKARIFVDDCGIGKTFTAKYLSKTRQNCFYIDGSQCKTYREFIIKIAKVIGVDKLGSLTDIKDNIKYYLGMFQKPIIIIDEAGDLNYNAFLELKEFWNATEGYCGWYLMGADGLRAKIQRGIRNQKVGFRELFSRFSGNYSKVVPTDRNEKKAFMTKTVRQVLEANIDDKRNLDAIVRLCITEDQDGNIGGLRRAESILILNQQNHD